MKYQTIMSIECALKHPSTNHIIWYKIPTWAGLFLIGIVFTFLILLLELCERTLKYPLNQSNHLLQNFHVGRNVFTWRHFYTVIVCNNILICEAMESYPTEILVHIFKQMFHLKSITECYNTNLRWQAILEELFKHNCKFLLLIHIFYHE